MRPRTVTGDITTTKRRSNAAARPPTGFAKLPCSRLDKRLHTRPTSNPPIAHRSGRSRNHRELARSSMPGAMIDVLTISKSLFPKRSACQSWRSVVRRMAAIRAVSLRAFTASRASSAIISGACRRANFCSSRRTFGRPPQQSTVATLLQPNTANSRGSIRLFHREWRLVGPSEWHAVDHGLDWFEVGLAVAFVVAGIQE
jgi:hypothetical protein